MKTKPLAALVAALVVCGCTNQGHPSDTSEQAQFQSEIDRESAIVAADEAARQRWVYSAKRDEMSSGVDRFATIESTNTVSFDSPYQGAQHARIVIRKMASHASSWKDDPGYEVLLFIDRGQLLSGNLGGIKARLDDSAPIHFDASAPSDDDSTVLFFDDSPKMKMTGTSEHPDFDTTFPLQDFIRQMQSSKTLKVQVTAFQNGDPVFTFNIAGFGLDKLNSAKPTSASP